MDLTFNRGWMCQTCGPVKESKKRSISKAQFDCCKICNEVVTPWERPLNERSGHCGNCGHASFKLALVKHHLVRCCKRCDEVYNVDARKTIRQGKEALKWSKTKVMR